MRIGIIGCGVAGQAAAIALAHDGHDVCVVERFESARPLGAGLLLQPSGLLALDRLGVRGEAEAWGAPIRELEGRTVEGRRVVDLRYADTEHGLGMHRGALFSVLHEAMQKSGARLRLSFEVERIDDLVQPRLASRDGAEEGPFDLVLDCAGAHDAMRASLGMRVRAPLYPWGALWTTCPDRSGAFAGNLRQVYDRASTMIGILPVGRVPASKFLGGHVAFFWSLKLAEFDAQRAAGLAALKTRVVKAWPQAEPIVAEIARFEDLSLATYRDVTVRPWRMGRVLVMGDAAHATSPQLGQGANLALIDAIVLAHCLRQTGKVDAALENYERARRAHIAYYQWSSWALTPAFQSDGRIVSWLRDIFLSRVNIMPGGRYMTRTTLSGVRKLPWGIWRPP